MTRCVFLIAPQGFMFFRGVLFVRRVVSSQQVANARAPPTPDPPLDRPAVVDDAVRCTPSPPTHNASKRISILVELPVPTRLQTDPWRLTRLETAPRWLTMRCVMPNATTENPRPVFRLSHFASRNSSQVISPRGIGATRRLSRTPVQTKYGPWVFSSNV
jgi:hypothetical protein